MGGLATRIDGRLKWELPGGGISAAAFNLAEYYGSTGKTAAAGVVMWTLASWRNSGGLRTQSEEVLRSVAAAALIVAPLKLAVRRRRPDGSDRLSFPSGHTATAFALSSVLARRHGPLVGLPAYGLAVLVPVGRIGEKKTPLFRRRGRGLHRHRGRVGGRNRRQQSRSSGSNRSARMAGQLEILTSGHGIPLQSGGIQPPNSLASGGLQQFLESRGSMGTRAARQFLRASEGYFSEAGRMVAGF